MRPIHLSEILQYEFMEPNGMSAEALASALEVPTIWITEIISEQRSIDADLATRLARQSSTTERFWLNLQNRYDQHLSSTPSNDINRKR